MMKKIVSFLILIVFISMLLCSCSHEIYTDGSATAYNGFTLICMYSDLITGYTKLAYDNNTKIVYLFTGKGVSPYYIIVDEEPTIAIYGVNYEYQE